MIRRKLGNDISVIIVAENICHHSSFGGEITTGQKSSIRFSSVSIIEFPSDPRTTGIQLSKGLAFLWGRVFNISRTSRRDFNNARLWLRRSSLYGTAKEATGARRSRVCRCIVASLHRHCVEYLQVLKSATRVIAKRRWVYPLRRTARRGRFIRQNDRSTSGTGKIM